MYYVWVHPFNLVLPTMSGPVIDSTQSRSRSICLERLTVVSERTHVPCWWWRPLCTKLMTISFFPLLCLPEKGICRRRASRKSTSSLSSSPGKARHTAVQPYHNKFSEEINKELYNWLNSHLEVNIDLQKMVIFCWVLLYFSTWNGAVSGLPKKFVWISNASHDDFRALENKRCFISIVVW